AHTIQAYYLARRRDGIIADQPSTSDSGTEIHSGKRYVVLRNSKGTLAVYRVHHAPSERPTWVCAVPACGAHAIQPLAPPPGPLIGPGSIATFRYLSFLRVPGGARYCCRRGAHLRFAVGSRHDVHDMVVLRL